MKKMLLSLLLLLSSLDAFSAALGGGADAAAAVGGAGHRVPVHFFDQDGQHRVEIDVSGAIVDDIKKQLVAAGTVADDAELLYDIGIDIGRNRYDLFLDLDALEAGDSVYVMEIDPAIANVVYKALFQVKHAAKVGNPPRKFWQRGFGIVDTVKIIDKALESACKDLGVDLGGRMPVARQLLNGYIYYDAKKELEMFQ
jgi:hypothetical protein